MDHAAVLALFDRETREGARPEGPGTRVERDARVARRIGAAHGWNGIVWSDLDESTADEAIAEQIRRFTGLGREFEWKVYGHDRPADLGERLRAAGFTPEPEETVMVAETAGPAPDIEPPEGIRLVPVTDATGVDLVADVHTKAFGTDSTWLRHRLQAQLIDAPDHVVVVVALAGDEPVSSARLELVPGTGFAGLWGGGTVPRWRGRGIYRALVAHRARIAASRGYRHLQVDATDRSRPILARLGFEALTTTTPYLFP